MTIPITSYGEFYDVPRQIEFQLDGRWFFLRSFFDEKADDYTEHYEVYLLPFTSNEELKSCPDYWRQLDKSAHLGQVRIIDVGLDPTRRRSVDARFLRPWLSARMKELGLE